MSVSYTYNQPDRVSSSTRAKVLASADELGYSGPHHGARALRSGRSNNLGVVLGEQLSYVFDDPGGRRFLAGIADACLEYNTGLVLLPNSGSSADLDRIRGAQVDGYVLWTTATDDPVMDAVIATGKPSCIQGGPRRSELGFVGIDDAAAARAVADVALRSSSRPAILGFPATAERRSAIVRGFHSNLATFPVTSARLIGYDAALTEHGFAPPDIPIAFASGNVRSEGARLGRILIDEFHADTVLAMSDELALGVVDAAHDLRVSVPGEVSVCGWDDSPEAGAAGLTTVAQSLFDQGRVAAQHALGTATLRPQDPQNPITDASPAGAWSVVRRPSTR